MSEQTVLVNNYYVDVEVTHFKPYVPTLWGATPEDSAEDEEYELTFDVIKAVRISDYCSGIDELPTLEEIENELVSILH